MIGVDLPWPVLPRQAKVVQVRGVDHVAAMLPYPILHPEDAACAGDPAFTDDLPQSAGNGAVIPRLKGICGRCVLKVACAEWGIAHERHLIFGGLTPEERVAIRKERRQIVVEPSSAHVYGLNDADHVEMRGGNNPDNIGALLAWRGIVVDELVHPLDGAHA